MPEEFETDDLTAAFDSWLAEDSAPVRPEWVASLQDHLRPLNREGRAEADRSVAS